MAINVIAASSRLRLFFNLLRQPIHLNKSYSCFLCEPKGCRNWLIVCVWLLFMLYIRSVIEWVRNPISVIYILHDWNICFRVNSNTGPISTHVYWNSPFFTLLSIGPPVSWTPVLSLGESIISADKYRPNISLTPAHDPDGPIDRRVKMPNAAYKYMS